MFLHDPTTVHLRTVCKFTEAHVLCYTLPSQISGSQESLVYCSPCPLGPAQFSLGSLGHGIPGTVSYRLPGAVTPWKPAMAGELFKRWLDHFVLICALWPGNLPSNVSTHSWVVTARLSYEFVSCLIPRPPLCVCRVSDPHTSVSMSSLSVRYVCLWYIATGSAGHLYSVPLLPPCVLLPCPILSTSSNKYIQQWDQTWATPTEGEGKNGRWDLGQKNCHIALLHLHVTTSFNVPQSPSMYTH